MPTRKEIVFSAIIILVAALFIFRPRDPDGEKTVASTGGMEVHAKAFKPYGLMAPFDCKVFLRAVGGSAGATSEIGLGITPEDFRAVVSGLPQEITQEVVQLGEFRQGDSIPLAIRTNWQGESHAFIGRQDQASLGAFTDTDGSLQEIGKQVIEPIGEKFLMHLDDAASFAIDDNDEDLLVEIWFERWAKP